MATAYRSFLVRYWRLEDGKRRIEIRRIRSDARTSVTTLAAALTWISLECGEPEGESGVSQLRAVERSGGDGSERSGQS